MNNAEQTRQEKNAKYANYGYTHFLHYTIEHKSLGTVHNQFLAFCDEKSCRDWVTAINGKAKRGKLPYHVTEFKIETV